MPKNRKAAPRTSKKSTARHESSPAKQPTTITPWLCLRGGAKAVEFYKKAFGAKEVFLLEGGGSVVARLAIDGAEFWLSDESPENHNYSPETLGGITTRIILTVTDPDAVFTRAIEAGAKEVFPPSDEHGWRVGRVVDPFGHHWEIARPLS